MKRIHGIISSCILLGFMMTLPLIISAQIDCSNPVAIEIIGAGALNQSNVALNIPSHATATSLTLEVIARPTGGNPRVTFTAGAQIVSPSGSTMPQYRNGSTGNTSDLLFRTTVSPTSTVSMAISDANAFSFVAYVESPSSSLAGYKGTNPIYTYHDAGVKFLDIPTHTETRNLTVTIPITELTNDPRIARVTVSAGGISQTKTANTYSVGNTLHYMTFTLNNVPGSASRIMIRSESPGGNGAAGSGNGDSFYTGSAVYTSDQCDCGAYASVSSSNTATSHALAASQGGIAHVQNAIGEPGTTFAEFYDNSDHLILELEEEVPAGSSYQVYWSSKNSSTSLMLISESSDGINFLVQPIALSVTGTSRSVSTVTAAQNTKYVRMDKESVVNVTGIAVTGGFSTGSSNDFNVYGLEYDFSAIGTGCSTAAFPVEWLDFTVDLFENDARIQWATASEQDADYFTVERSVDGNMFLPLDLVPAVGNSQTVNTYQYEDMEVKQLGIRKLYYRIGETDLNGATTYSKVVELSVPGNFPMLLRAYPNPASDLVSITLESSGTSDPELRVLNPLGQPVHSERLSLNQAQASTRINVQDWTPGIYIVYISDESQQTSFRLLVR